MVPEKYKKNPRTEDRKTYEKLASVGFLAALNLLCLRRQFGPLDAVSYVANKLKRDPLQIASYKQTGIPDHLVGPVIEILEANGIKFGCHQLRPNTSMVRKEYLDNLRSKNK
ncbi:hypothetical protein [Vibrio harveyi]|uniref:hypothetical protein n=1 Tax=Vibrio harveyi TaxID=669 RepID=UPI0025AFBD90|nr:hypothetical protein [Vibrio harveyi]WJT09254.1 hypothetical protein PH545_24825 [Vibrio harveyi]